MRQAEFADAGVERIAVHPGAGGIHEQRAGAVQRITGGDLMAAALQQVRQGGVGAQGAVDGEDGANGNARVDVGGAVQGVEQHDVRAARLVRGEKQGVFGLLGGQGANVAAGPQGVDQHVMGQHVELAHRFALHVVLAGETENVDQPGAVDLVRDTPDRQSQGGEQASQVIVSGVPPAVIPAQAGIHQVLGKRHALAIHDDSLHEFLVVSVALEAPSLA